MKVDQEGYYSDFCCFSMEEFSKKPNKCISFDPLWRVFDVDKPEHRAVIFSLEKSGLAVEQSFAVGRNGSAGQTPQAINYCPWCSKLITFET